MAVPCPRCGRGYDVTLFDLGRTIWCTCGSRVGIAPRVRALDCGRRTRFLADVMLGRTARWLRLLGFDCAYEKQIGDRDLVARAIEEQRIVLTRDRGLAEDWRVSGIYVVRAERTFDQLVEVLRHFQLADSVRLFSRCSECNAPVEPVETDDVRARVPARIVARHDELRRCRECDRVYWEGSHTRRMRRSADRVLAAVQKPNGGD